MSRVKSLAVAGAAVLSTISIANAADLPAIIQKAPPIPVEEYSGWYLRGDIGFSSEQARGVHEDLTPAPDSVQQVGATFDGAGIFRLGVGYQFTSWLRADVTGEYRTGANFRGFDITTSAGNIIPEHATARKSEIVVLGNVYVDLGTWWCLTPFVGAGVGFADNRLSNFTEVANFAFSPGGGTTILNANNFAADHDKFNFAWAVHAGVAYRATPGMSVELAYRYLDLGSAESGAIVGFLNNPQNSVFHIDHVTSHDVTLGVRWLLQPEPVAPYAPLVRKG
jgi:opacity protein-like surface antigen